MKRIFAITTLALFLIAPLFAQGAVETVGEWTTAITGAGVGVGAVIGGLLGPVGAVVGAIIGGVATSGIGIEVQKKKDDAALSSNEGDIEQMQLQNKAAASQNDKLGIALATWQNDYDLAVSDQQTEAERTLDTLKQNWGLTNAVLGSQNREGATARLLSQKQRNEVVRFAGEDMKLNNDEVLKRVNDIYNDSSNFDELGNMTDAGKQKLALVGDKYGSAELAMNKTAIEQLNTKKTTATTIDLNDEAIRLNNEAIQGLTDENTVIKKRQRWMK
jgi:hypothetical protein